MDILLAGLLAGLVGAAVAVAVVMLVQRPRAVQAGGAATVAAPEKVAAGEPKAGGRRDGLEEELLARRAEIARQEERLHARDTSLEALSQQLAERERSLRTAAATSITRARSSKRRRAGRCASSNGWPG